MTALLILVFFYAATCLAMFTTQSRFIYRPSLKLVDKPDGPAFKQLGFLPADTKTSDGLTIRGFYKRATTGQPTILMLHGNGGSISDRIGPGIVLGRHGRGVMLADYRGYSGNPGSPGERGLMADGQAAWDYLIAQGVPPGDIIVFGESLGTGVAVQLTASLQAAATPPRALILEMPYDSLSALAARNYRWLPVTFLMRDHFASIDYIGAIQCPVLVLHGDADKVIPLASAQRLFAAVTAPKRQMIVVPGAGHEHLYKFDDGASIERFIAEVQP